MRPVPPTLEVRSMVRRFRLDWSGVALCAFLLAFPLPGAARIMTLTGSEIATSSQEEMRHEIATQRRLEEFVSPESDGGYGWMAPSPSRPRGAALADPASSAPPRGHRLANGHNAPMAC
ncbi:MAG: hypothetical protein WD066_07200 [Planctomycetaceae bacterium]